MIKFGNKNNNTSNVFVEDGTTSLTLSKSITQSNDIMSVEYKEQLRNLPEVQSLTNNIDLNNLNSIVEFGNDASSNLHDCTDRLLSVTKKVESGKMSQALMDLAAVMDECDLKSLSIALDSNHKKKLLYKLKGYYRNINKLITKYETSTREVDKVKVVLDGYKNDLRISNMSLEQHRLELVKYFGELEKYIVAAELGLEEIDALRQEISNEVLSEADKVTKLQALDLAHSTLQERLMNLQAAEAVAMQSVPLIKTMQESNLYLYNKIETQFIVTLPIFKSSLLQAIELRRQKAITDSLLKVDAVTNKLLEANAKNTVQQSIAIHNMASSSTIKIETLENTYNIIQNGLGEIERLNKENLKARLDASDKLVALKAQFSEKHLQLTSSDVKDDVVN